MCVSGTRDARAAHMTTTAHRHELAAVSSPEHPRRARFDIAWVWLLMRLGPHEGVVLAVLGAMVGIAAAAVIHAEIWLTVPLVLGMALIGFGVGRERDNRNIARGHDLSTGLRNRRSFASCWSWCLRHRSRPTGLARVSIVVAPNRREDLHLSPRELTHLAGGVTQTVGDDGLAFRVGTTSFAVLVRGCDHQRLVALAIRLRIRARASLPPSLAAHAAIRTELSFAAQH